MMSSMSKLRTSRVCPHYKARSAPWVDTVVCRLMARPAPGAAEQRARCEAVPRPPRPLQLAQGPPAAKHRHCFLSTSLRGNCKLLISLPSRLPCLSVDVMLQAPAVAPQQGAAPALGLPRQQQPGQERALQVTTNRSLVDGSLEMFQSLPNFVPSPGRRLI